MQKNKISHSQIRKLEKRLQKLQKQRKLFKGGLTKIMDEEFQKTLQELKSMKMEMNKHIGHYKDKIKFTENTPLKGFSELNHFRSKIFGMEQRLKEMQKITHI